MAVCLFLVQILTLLTIFDMFYIFCLRSTPTTMLSFNWSNSSFDEGRPNSSTTGNPVGSDFNFNANRGPISPNAPFSVDRKAYLKTRE